MFYREFTLKPTTKRQIQPDRKMLNPHQALEFLLISILIISIIPKTLADAPAEPGSITFEFYIDTVSSTGLLFLFLVVFASFNLVWPFIRYIYVFYVDRWVTKAKKQMDEVAARLSERISDAGRKVSEQVRV